MTTPPPPSLSQRVLSAAAWNTLLFPVQFVVGLLASVLMLNYLPPAQYTLLTLLTGLAASLGLYADLGIERSLPRFIPEIEQRAGRAGVAHFLRRVIALKLGLVCVFIVGLQLLSGPLIAQVTASEQARIATLRQQHASLVAAGAPAAQTERLARELDGTTGAVAQLAAHGRLFLWAVCALVLFGAVYDVFMQFLTAYFKQRAWNAITAVVALLQPLLVVLFIGLNMGLSGVLLGMVITPVVAVALAAWQTLRAASELQPSVADAPPDPTLPGRFLRFSAISFLTQLTNWFYDVAFVVFVLTALGTGLEQVALLAFAYTFAKNYLSYAYLPFGGLLTPLLARIRGRNDPAALQDAYGSLSRMFALILLPAGVGLMLITPRLLALLYPRYTAAAELAFVLIAFAFAESLLSVPHNVLMVYERYRPVLLARLLALVNVPLLAGLVLYGPPEQLLLGCALAVGLARLLPRLYTLLVVRRALGLRYPLRFVGRVLAATAAFGAPLLLIQQVWPLPPDASGWSGKLLAGLSLAALAALAALGYLAALRLLGGLDAQERQRLLGLKLPLKRHLAKLL